MGDSDRVELFDSWAGTYESTVQSASARYPFAGYDAVLAAIGDIVVASGATKLLELGIGTGALSEQIVHRVPEMEVWGLDFSDEMLARARSRLPAAHLLKFDLSESLRSVPLPEVGSVVASYILHEFTDDKKVDMIQDTLLHRIVAGGVMVVGDIAFETRRHHDTVREAHADCWDDSEHYFIADEFLRSLEGRHLAGTYRQMSLCAGIFTLTAVR